MSSSSSFLGSSLSPLPGMAAKGSSVPKCDDEEQALKGLLDAFSSTFSLEEIASAFCKAGRNADLAAEVIFDMQGSTSTFDTSLSNAEATGAKSTKSSCGNFSEKIVQANGNSRSSKTKSRPLSGGTVSSILGKDYIRSVPSTNGSCKVDRPIKKVWRVASMSELSEVEAESSSLKDDIMHQDMEDFLFKTLGDEFKLDRGVIQQVLDNCGYDMEKSMEKLLNLPVVALDKRNVVGESTEKLADMGPKTGLHSHENKLQYINHPESNENEVEPQEHLKEEADPRKEVLVALFNAPERLDESPRRARKPVKRSVAYWRVVDGPLDFDLDEEKTVVHLQKDNEDDEEEEDDYQRLRTSVKEYWVTMKEYYQAAVDAFAKGDQVRAGKLLGKAYFFHNKAREADEESNRILVESRNAEAEDEIMMLDLHACGAKEAVRLLKCHLSSLSGIPSLKQLKVIIETNDEDITKGSRRKLVIKLLEKESIKWTEEGNAGTILIRLDSINRKHLSFSK